MLGWRIQDTMSWKTEVDEIDIDVAGGVPPYIYSWSNGAITQDLKNVISGRYSVLITDANNCTDSITDNVYD